MIYHVEVWTGGGKRTDMTTRSRYEAAYRARALQGQGYLAEVRTGSGRLVVDALGQEER